MARRAQAGGLDGLGFCWWCRRRARRARRAGPHVVVAERRKRARLEAPRRSSCAALTRLLALPSDNIASAPEASESDFGRCMLLRAHKLLFRAVLCQILPAIGSSDLSRLVAALVLSAITFVLSKRGRTKMTVPKNSAELETKRTRNAGSTTIFITGWAPQDA